MSPVAYCMIFLILCGGRVESVRDFPGIALEVTNSALGFLSSVVKQAIPKVLQNIQLIDQTGLGWHAFNLMVTNVTPPEVKSRFIPDTGIQVSALMDLINITGQYQLGIGWLSTVGNLVAEIHSLKMDTVISVEVNPIGLPQFNIEECRANDSYVLVTVDGSLSSLINSMNDILGDYLRDTLDQLLCESVREAAEAIKRRYDESTGESKPSPMCPRDPEYSSSSATMSAFSINASMIENPSVFRDAAWIGLNGTMLYNKQNPTYQPVQFSLKSLSQRRMVNVIVSELVPNSFFSHVFAHSLARIEEGVNLVDVPRPLRGFFGHLCPGCSTKVQAGLSKAPKLNISHQNVEIVMDGWVRTVASIFFKRIDLFRVTVKINANVFPYVNRGRLVADTRITSIDLDVNNIGLGPVLGLFTDDMIQAVNNFVPVHVGPPVKDELRLVFHENGIPLPSICGIRLKQPHVRYIDRALVIEADLDYNPEPLIEHMRKIISGKAHMDKK